MHAELSTVSNPWPGVISYAYDHKIVILDRVTLLIRYEGSTREAVQ